MNQSYGHVQANTESNKKSPAGAVKVVIAADNGFDEEGGSIWSEEIIAF